MATARKIQSLIRRGEVATLTPEQRKGPFSRFVVAFDGIPLAAGLRAAIDETLAGPGLRRRTKALIFAVVARALACPLSEAESTALLAEEGLAPEAVERILAHLAGPELDKVESIALPFARDTVWYRQAAPIQRRAQQVADALPAEIFLDLIVTASMANMICRLGVAVDSPD